MLRVRDIMATDVVTIRPETDLRRATEFLVRHHVSGAPVVANGRVVGVVSATDLLEFMRAIPTAAPVQPETPAGLEAPGTYYIERWADDGADVSARFRTIAAPEWDQLLEHTVEQVMSRSLCAVRPDATVMSAADYLLRTGVHRVLVVDNGKLIGILTTTDIVRAVAQGRLSDVAVPLFPTVPQHA